MFVLGPYFILTCYQTDSGPSFFIFSRSPNILSWRRVCRLKLFREFFDMFLFPFFFIATARCVTDSTGESPPQRLPLAATILFLLASPCGRLTFRQLFPLVFFVVGSVQGFSSKTLRAALQ